MYLTSMLRKMSSCLQVSAAKTQQRLVHRQTFEMPEVKQFVEELSVDGVRFASALLGNPALGKNTRGALARPEAIGAYFQDNDALIEGQPPTACLTNHLLMGMTEFGTSSTKLPLTVNVGKFSIGIT